VGLAKGQIWLGLHKLLGSRSDWLKLVGEVWAGRVEEILRCPEADVVDLVGPELACKLTSLRGAVKEVKGDWSELRRLGIKLVPFTDKRYPSPLRRVERFPPILYMLGNQALLQKPSVGICGSRNSSDAGLRNARNFGQTAGKHGLVVVSGYAKGIDTMAHLGAIDSDGCTIVVLPEGINHFRRKRQFSNISDFDERTLIISQFYPKMTWQVSAAMERNTVICGLSNAVAIVEAGETGGTIAAGRVCLAQKKPLWVIDYDKLPLSASGNRTLINEGGISLRSRREWIYALANVLTNSEKKRKTARARTRRIRHKADFQEARLPPPTTILVHVPALPGTVVRT